jgi:hypothetical protein
MEKLLFIGIIVGTGLLIGTVLELTRRNKIRKIV